MAKCNQPGSLGEYMFFAFCPISDSFTHYFIYIESLIIHRILRTIMEPDGYFEAMKCKGAYGISLYPFWSSNYIIGPT